MAKNKHGTCSLTGQPGMFVDAHVLPLALTRLSKDGKKAIEAQLNTPQRRRFSGWYDNELVTREGEDILAEIDSNAIQQLREQQLVWSGFDDNRPLTDLIRIEGLHLHRLLALGSAKDLRLFFLSVLWRAARSSRPEFAEIQLDDHSLEALRVKLLARNPGPLIDFPIQLFQIVTKGPPHNRSVILEQKDIQSARGVVGTACFARIYLEGLVAHVHISSNCEFPSEYLATCLGNPTGTLVFAHPFEESRTRDNLLEVIANNLRPSR